MDIPTTEIENKGKSEWQEKIEMMAECFNNLPKNMPLEDKIFYSIGGDENEIDRDPLYPMSLQKAWVELQLHLHINAGKGLYEYIRELQRRNTYGNFK